MKVGRLVLYPGEKAPDSRVGPDRSDTVPEQGELRIGEGPMQRPMANRMDRHRLAPAAALRNRMVTFAALSEQSAAQPASFVGVGHPGEG